MSGSLWFLLNLLALLSVAALLFTWLGWWMRGKLGKSGATCEEVDVERTRANASEERIRKLEAEAKASKSEIAELQVRLRDRSEIDKLTRDLAAEREKAEGLNTQLKKARGAQGSAEARNADANKGAQARVFELQNELARAREEVTRANLLAASAGQEIAKAKSSTSANAGEVKELGNQVIALRKEASAAIKAAEEAKTARDAMVADLAAARETITKLTEELAQSKTRSGSAAATTTVAMPATPRGVSEEQFNAVRSALNNAQKERDAALEAKEAAEAEAEELRSQLTAASSATAKKEGDATLADLEAAKQAITQMEAELATLKSGSALAGTSTHATTSLAEAGSAVGLIDAAGPDVAGAVHLARQLEEARSECDSLRGQVSALRARLEASENNRGEGPPP